MMNRMQGYLMHIHRPDTEWTCPECGKVIRGKSNTIHLGVISHFRKHRREKNDSELYKDYYIERS